MLVSEYYSFSWFRFIKDSLVLMLCSAPVMYYQEICIMDSIHTSVHGIAPDNYMPQGISPSPHSKLR